MVDEEGGEDQEGCADAVVPLEFFTEIGDGKDRKDGKGDDFLNGLELSSVEFVRADAVGGDLKAVFKKGDAPAGDDHFPERFAAVFEVPYQAKVMKMLEIVSRTMVRIFGEGSVKEDANHETLPENEALLGRKL